MITLVTGGAACGKSSYAENLLQKFNGPKYYIATMHNDMSEETIKRINRHQKLRHNKGFDTLELETDIVRAVYLCGESYKSCIIECMANLLANEMYINKKKNAHLSIFDDIKRISEKFDNVVIVSNEVALDGNIYDDFTMKYIESLQCLNRELSYLADNVVEIVYSIPIVIKGEVNENN